MEQLNWLTDATQSFVECKYIKVITAKLTKQARVFIFLYGLKQYLADKIANKGEAKGYNDAERKAVMAEYAGRLMDEKFKLVLTPKGFTFKDPDAVTVPKTPKEKAETTLKTLEADIKSYRAKMIATKAADAKTIQILIDATWGEQLKTARKKVKDLK